MARTVPFTFVDVFASEPLTGNPLAVVAEASDLREDVMKAIAREFNQSETTFVLPATDAGAAWRLRSFTPAGVEVGGAGHNALGAWWWLAASGTVPLLDGEMQTAQQIAGRVLPLWITSEGGQPRTIVMEQGRPEIGQSVRALDGLADALGLRNADLSTDLPAQVVSTGAPHLLVQAVDRAAVDRATPDATRLARELRDVGGEGCYLYCLDPVESTSVAYARFFNPTVGIVEDPATGTAAGPLACHLVAHGVVDDGSTVLIEQGHLIGRPSLIEIAIHGPHVTIAGTCVIAADGVLHLAESA